MGTQRVPDAGGATGDVMSMDNASGPAQDASGVPFERSPRRESPVRCLHAKTEVGVCAVELLSPSGHAGQPAP